jgi:hypothetical protein
MNHTHHPGVSMPEQERAVRMAIRAFAQRLETLSKCGERPLDVLDATFRDIQMAPAILAEWIPLEPGTDEDLPQLFRVHRKALWRALFSFKCRVGAEIIKGCERQQAVRDVLREFTSSDPVKRCNVCGRSDCEAARVGVNASKFTSGLPVLKALLISGLPQLLPWARRELQDAGVDPFTSYKTICFLVALAEGLGLSPEAIQRVREVFEPLNSYRGNFL